MHVHRQTLGCIQMGNDEIIRACPACPRLVLGGWQPGRLDHHGRLGRMWVGVGEG